MRESSFRTWIADSLNSPRVYLLYRLACVGRENRFPALVDYDACCPGPPASFPMPFRLYWLLLPPVPFICWLVTKCVCGPELIPFCAPAPTFALRLVGLIEWLVPYAVFCWLLWVFPVSGPGLAAWYFEPDMAPPAPLAVAAEACSWRLCFAAGPC